MKKKINASLKLKIAIEAFKGDMTIGELTLRYEVSPVKFIVGSTSFWIMGQRLHANIGSLTVENDFLSRALGQLK